MPGYGDILAGSLANFGSGIFKGLAQGRAAEDEKEDLRLKRERQGFLDRIQAERLKLEQQRAGQPTISGRRGVFPLPGGGYDVRELPETDVERSQRESHEATTGYHKAQTKNLLEPQPKTPILRLETKVEAEGLGSLNPGERALWDAHHKPVAPPHQSPHYMTDDNGNVVAITPGPPGPSGAPSFTKTPLGGIGKKAKSAGGGFGDEGMTPVSIEEFAQGVADGGAMPALGMGKSKDRTRILNRVGEIRKERRGSGSLAVQQAQFQADKKALARNAQDQAKFGAFATSFEKTIDNALALANRLDAKGIKTWNRFKLQALAESGDADANNLLGQMSILAREADRVLSRATGAGSNESRAEAAKLMDPGLSSGQFRSLVENVLRKDKLYATMGFEEEHKRILEGMRGYGKLTGETTAPAAPVPAAPAGPQPNVRKFNPKTGRLE